MKRLRQYVVGGSLLALGFGAGLFANNGRPAEAQTGNRVFELRIATLTTKDKVRILMDRFRGGELDIWEKHGMESVGFWVPTADSPKSEHTLFYLLAHESREQADESWANFFVDPAWEAFPKEPGLGPVSVERIYLDPVDFSPLK
jgi:hypothetical protein